MIKIRGLAWIVSYNCNLNCPHCFFDTDSTKILEPETVRAALNGLDDPSELGWHHLTGGEPLLDEEALVAILDALSEHKAKRIGIASNAVWASSQTEAKRVVAKLRRHGVSGICVSADSFHQPAVPVDNVRRAIDAIGEAGLGGHSYVVSCKFEADTAYAKKMNAKTDEVLTQLGESPLPHAPTTVRYMGHSSRKGNACEVPEQPCSQLSCCLGDSDIVEPQMVWIDPYGNVMICYGIVIGNVCERPLQQILVDYSKDQHPILQLLAEGGPKALHGHACQLGWDAPNAFADECDVCSCARAFLRGHYPEVLGPAECYPCG